MSRAERTLSEALRADGLSAGYGGGLVLDRLDLAVPRAAFTALIGPNGCGKSTLLRAFARLLPLAHGTVLVDGRSIASMTAKQAARRVGILAQGPATPEGLTVGELVREGRYPHRRLFSGWSEADESAWQEALALTGMAALAERPVASLSGGQRQRAWIAMALAQRTDILLLDEPTTYLDLAHQLDILELIQKLVCQRRTTIVAVLHDINQAARHADHVVMLKDGRIVAQGTPEAVLTAENMERVFKIRALITPSPVDGKVLVLPIGKARSGP